LGASVVANGLHRVSSDVAAVVHLLEREFAALSFANAYTSFRGVQAFQTHYDLHDVFAVQMEGEKTWRIYEGRADNPVAPLPPGDEVEKWLIASRGPLLFEAVMKPGDLLYLPRGQYHDALTGAQASLHVTFGVQPLTGLALFKLLESVLTRESAFRAYLPDARNPAEFRGRLGALADHVKAVMNSQAFATEVLNQQRSLAQAPPSYDLPSQARPIWYSVTRPAPVVRRDEGYFLVLDRHQVPLDASYGLIEWALQQRFFSIEDALARYPAVRRDELLAVLEQLAKLGVVAETTMRQ
jgi:ribosomal protein L16 Arg81 hydroxylase